MRIKTLFIGIVAMAISFVCAGQAKPAHANMVIKEATKLAIAQKKNVLILFTASWCGWCHKMDKSITDTACKNLFEKNYIVRHLVVDESADKKNRENPGADSLKTKYNGEDQGIPFWLVFDGTGKLLADSRAVNKESGHLENTGCPATETEVACFIDVLKRTSSLKATELQIISKRFRQNEN
jgi:thioredoxin-related protein